MVDFDKKLLCFLDYFKKRQKFKSVSQTAKALGISRRMIYYYINKLNDILKLLEMPSITKDEQGYFVIAPTQCIAIEAYFQEKKNQSNYIFKKEERVILIASAILFHTKILRVKTFELYFGVSKNTIISDLNAVKKWFERYHIVLLNDKKQGYYVDSAVKHQRNLIFEMVKTIEVEDYHELFENILTFNQDVQRVQQYQSFEFEFYRVLDQYEYILHKKVSLANKRILCRCLFLSLIFHSTQPMLLQTIQRKMIEERLEFYISQQLVKQLVDTVPEIVNEVYFMAIQLLCISKDYDFYYDSDSFKDLMCISEMFIEEFESATSLHFKNKAMFLELIQTLMKVVYYRQFFAYADRCQLTVSLDQDMMGWLDLTQHIMENLSKTSQFQQKFNRMFSPSDLVEFVCAIQALYVEHQTTPHHLDIVIVTNISKVEQTILYTKLKDLLAIGHFHGPYSEREATTLHQQFDLCITTSPYYNHPHCQTIHIHKYLTLKDYERLYQLKQYRLSLHQRKAEIFQIIDNEQLSNEEKFKFIEELYGPKMKSRKS
ncbi:BglG family transcription antiterminator [Staphylococcus lutrae]|uniref:Transcriptional antiterminator n=1 Tax=Staphylococcus lutrae TaxID=155085 RepID=A0AAC9RR51_9STAP|nr:NUMOD1 domain-containing DNA-binding protein [Staphylococcus lutrae]ARJ50074.1 transcriptional antiterminator [Staphylococcus lutrae]PNZ38354.1 transcriptional antiterminator [Staphylococcus lutrae]